METNDDAEERGIFYKENWWKLTWIRIYIRASKFINEVVEKMIWYPIWP